MERFIERISLSNYRKNIIVKGGLLISSIVGLESRTTMDIDMTVKGKTVDEKSILNMIKEISNIKIEAV
ncbi:nucleotidyl transferase AbiEii/AbiGii toxin family protein [Gemella morbillorum]|uniref:nucleotidyl transferase AbiEii/AbiGii toxin family protein n=1 Tax=Gemella morbillorum TaxID=29391 RepID=UPI0028D4F7DF|nr:nucleotidyl transferase AbiEii/AbiGii toxin family protein [Gemella morbillorum]